jgi:hypothetical protein
MSNYPLGAENDSNAPFNRKEEKLQGETIGLFEYLENLEMPYSIRCELKKFNTYLNQSQIILKDLATNEDNPIVMAELFLVKRLLTQPQIFIEE